MRISKGKNNQLIFASSKCMVSNHQYHCVWGTKSGFRVPIIYGKQAVLL